MHRSGAQGWSVVHVVCELNLDIALWTRAALGLSVQPDDLVPGPLADPDVAPVMAVERSPELAAEWSHWWASLVTARHDPVSQRVYAPPEFEALAQWPQLRSSVLAHWEGGLRWNTARKARMRLADRVAVPARGIVDDVAESLARSPRPFRLELLIIPVNETRVRAVTTTRYLVPEGVYADEAWTSQLREIVLQIA